MDEKKTSGMPIQMRTIDPQGYASGNLRGEDRLRMCVNAHVNIALKTQPAPIHIVLNLYKG